MVSLLSCTKNSQLVNGKIRFSLTVTDRFQGGVSNHHPRLRRHPGPLLARALPGLFILPSGEDYLPSLAVVVMNTTSADTFDSSQLKDVNNLEVTEIESTEDEFQPKLSSQSIEETITRATATAIAYAEFNQRSDSILSPDNSECGGDDHEDDDSSYFFVSKGQSAEMRSSMCLDENDSIREWEHSRFCSDPVNLSGLPQETEHPVAIKKNN